MSKLRINRDRLWRSLMDMAAIGATPKGGNCRLALSDEDKLTVFRARKIQRFLTQPFHVAEVFTGNPGVYVSRDDTVRSFKAILDGEDDHLAEDAFYMVGTIEDAVEKNKTISD